MINVIFLSVFFLCPFSVFAKSGDELSLTLTPPLFQITQAPGGVWSSNLRVVNTNNFDLVVSATVQDFRPDGETGNAVFMSSAKGAPEDTSLMSGWITVPDGDIIVKRGTTALVPFTVHVPENADPGGHYAAILVGTRPTRDIDGSGAGISSAISSLFFLRVPGDVVEEGAIRDFYAEKSMLQSPNASFVLRFENTGNVHLVPEGAIIITNMWGKERGKIDVNKVNTFGNVLPGSTRKFEFKWQGEENLFEFGRYKALATLVYGEDGRKTVYRTVYFWIIPWKQVLPFALGLGSFIWFVTWSLRRYIRKALALERERLGLDPIPEKKTTSQRGANTPTPAPQVTLEVLRRPLALDSVDLRATKTDKTNTDAPFSVSFGVWMRKNRSFVGFIFVIILGFSLIGWYFVEVFQGERAYHVEQVKDR